MGYLNINNLAQDQHHQSLVLGSMTLFLLRTVSASLNNRSGLIVIACTAMTEIRRNNHIFLYNFYEKFWFSDQSFDRNKVKKFNF